MGRRERVSMVARLDVCFAADEDEPEPEPEAELDPVLEVEELFGT